MRGNTLWKKIGGLVGVILVVCIFASVPACETPSQTGDTGSAEQDEASGGKSATLITVLSRQSPQSHSMPYDGELTYEKLAQGLSKLTGLGFDVAFRQNGDDVYVAWLSTSTLLHDDPTLEQKDAFRVYDYDSMIWFLLDSLYQTLMANFDIENVYYSAEDGQPLYFENMTPPRDIPVDTPYEQIYTEQPGGQA